MSMKTDFQKWLDKPETAAFLKSLQELAPKGYSVARMGKQLLVAANKNPKIYLCTAASIFEVLTDAAEMGLNVSGLTGEAYIIPYTSRKTNVTKAQLQVGYPGHLKILRRSEKIASVSADVIRENDTLVNRRGTNPEFIHEPAREDRGEITHAYALIHYHTGGCEWVVLDKAEIDERKDQSWGSSDPDSIWGKWYAEMAKKTALRAVCKYADIYSGQEALERTETRIFEENERLAKAKERNLLNDSLGLGPAQEPEVESEPEVEVEGEAKTTPDPTSPAAKPEPGPSLADQAAAATPAPRKKAAPAKSKAKPADSSSPINDDGFPPPAEDPLPLF